MVGMTFVPYASPVMEMETMPTYSCYEDWLNNLKADQLGRLWLAKLEFDVAKGNLPPEAMLNLSGFIEGNLHTIESLLSHISVINFAVTQSPMNFDLQGLRLPSLNEPYSCIVRLEVFGLYLVKQRVLSTVIDESDDDMDFIWDNLGGLINASFHEGELRTERAFFWCTPTEQLTVLGSRCSPNKAATVLRTRLGLHQMSKGQRLIRIDIPSDIIVNKTIRAPTTLDGGSNPVFVPSSSTDGYGRTLNLKNVVRDLKELVVEKIPFTSDFVVTKVGKVGARVPPVNLNDIEILVK
jgi:hypothetical protein